MGEQSYMFFSKFKTLNYCRLKQPSTFQNELSEYLIRHLFIFNYHMNPSTTYRIASIDILRGIVMVIMALDHTRDFFHITAMTANPLDPATTTPILFFTRWITHLCAPTFVFLSGLSAYLSSQKKSFGEASLFLFKR